MTENQRQLIHNYWNKTELGKMMIQKYSASDLDLLFLIPNNKKKILGLPMTRLGNKRNKKKYKVNRIKSIVALKVFDIIEEINKQRLSNINFDNFIDYKNLELGDINIWH